MILIIVIFLGLILLGFPIVISIGLSGVIYLLNYGPDLTTLLQRMVGGVDRFVLLAIPFFVLAGNIMNLGGSTRRIFGFANSIVGGIPGGLAHVNVVASIIFAGMSGSALADAAGLGTVEIRAMRECGFRREFSAALTAASATVGPIIPPSISFVIYGALAQESVGKLFLGGFIPGLIMAFSLMLMIFVLDKKMHFPRSERKPIAHTIKYFFNTLPVLGTPIIIVGAIVLGVTTPTEAGAIAVLYAVFIGIFVYRELDLEKIYQALNNTIRTTASIMIIVSTASVLGYILILEDLPGIISKHLLSISTNPTIILLMLNATLLILGCFIEDVSIMVLMIPVIKPLALELGIDPIHLGVIVVLNLMIGLATPPFGLLLFIVSGIAEIRVEKIIKQIIPLFIPLIFSLILFTLIPAIVTFLPNLFME